MKTYPRFGAVRFVLVSLILASAGVIAGPLSRGALAAGADETPAEPALQGFDPVLLTQGKEVKGQAEISLTREGFRYLFVDAASKAKFEKDPERYGVQFHGKCAMMPSAAAQPDLFTVYKGKLYAFGSEDCRTAFLQSPESYVKGDGLDRDRHAGNVPPQAAGRRPATAASSAREGAPHPSVVIFVFNNMELLDFAGPAEAFASAGFEVSTVAKTREPIPCMGVITITPRYTLDDCPRSDIVVVPGGRTQAVAMDKQVTDWLAHASGQAEVTLSVCTGAFVLANAGLLDGKEATTHWSAIERMRKQFPKISVRNDQRVVDTGKVVTSAGVSAGIDGALHVVARLAGRSAAAEAARYMEYNWQPTQQAKK
jgi:putative intracellular protease/amidase/YHS domain-containing protein